MVSRAMLGVLLLVLVGASACGDRAHREMNTGSGGRPLFAPRDQVAAVILDAGGRKRASVSLEGSIQHATADGSGGWFVSVVGKQGASYALAHLDARGRVDPKWRPSLGPNPPDDRYANLAAGGRLVYLAGNFAGINGVSRRSLGAVAVASGSVEPSWPTGRSDFSGAAAIVLAGDRVIVAHGQRIEALDAGTGQPVRGFDASTGPDNTEGPGVRALAVSGRWVYVGGRFTKVDGVRRVGLARIDRLTGRVDAGWRPPVFNTTPCLGCDGDVMGLASSDDSLYVLGGFSAIGGLHTAGGLAALSQATGKPATGFRAPPPGRDAAGDSGAYTSAATIGRRLFVAGDFGAAGDVPARGLVVLDALSGSPLSSWHPSSRRASVSLLAASGAQMLVGGTGLG